MPTSNEDYLLIQEWRRRAEDNQRVLFDNIKPKQHLHGCQNESLVTCGELGCCHDIFTRHSEVHQQGRLHVPRIRLFAWNGGVFRLTPSLTSQKGDHATFLSEIVDAIRTEDLHGLSLYGHWPCVRASESHLNLLQAIEVLMMTKHSLKGQFPELKISSFFHIDYGRYASGKMRSYFLRRRKWLAWKEAYGLSTINVEKELSLPPGLTNRFPRPKLTPREL